MKIISVVILFVALASGMPTTDNQEKESTVGSVIGAVQDCVNGDVSLCLKEKALNYAEDIVAKREVNLADGVTLVGTGSPRSARALEPLSEEPRARESQIESRLVDLAADFLENHVLQFRLPSADVESVKRSIEEGRKKKKIMRKLGPILALLKLKFTALIPLFLGILAFVAVKALLLAKIAILAIAAQAIKKLLASKNENTSYEVVAHPHHEVSSHGGGHHEEHYGGGGSSGWGRSQDEAQNLAYAAYAKN